MKKIGPQDKIKYAGKYDKEVALARKNKYSIGEKQEFIDVSKKGTRTFEGVKIDSSLLKDYVGDSPYILLHSHTEENVLPSRGDLDVFLSCDPAFSDDADTDKYKTMAIADTDKETGEVRGYFILRKSRKTPRLINSIKPSKNAKSVQSELLDRFDSIFGYNEHLFVERKEELASKTINALDYLNKEYGIRYKFVPAKGYRLSDDKSHFIKVESKHPGLESKVVGPIALLFLVISLLLLVPSLSGYFILNESYINNLNYSSLIFFIIGLILSVIYFLKKKI